MNQIMDKWKVKEGVESIQKEDYLYIKMIAQKLCFLILLSKLPCCRDYNYKSLGLGRHSLKIA